MANAVDIERPKRYFALHFRLFRFLGLGWWHHPDEENTENFPSWYLFYSIITQVVWVAGFVGLETLDPFVSEKDLDRFMFSLSFVITHDLTLIKLGIFIFKNLEIQQIAHTLEIELHQFYQNNTKNWATVKITRILTFSFVFFGWVTIGNTDLYGTVQDFRWKALVATLNDTDARPLRTLPQPIYIPWGYQSNKSFTFTFILETVGLLWTGHIVMTIDTLIGSIILHMSCQFEVLQEAILTAYDRTMVTLNKSRPQQSSDDLLNIEENTEDLEHLEQAVKMAYSEQEIEEALEKSLKSCYRQYQILIGCVEKFANTYSYGFMTQLLSSMAAICVVMVQVSQDASSFKSVRLVTSLAFFVAMIIQLAIQCFTGNELTHQASKILDAVMQCKWERMPPRLRKSLIIIMIRSQKPLRLTAAGFANMDNACFLSILKAAYSYYAVLSQKQG